VTGFVLTDTGVVIGPDPHRVISRFFVPGREDVGPGESRAAPVIDRVLALEEQFVEQEVVHLERAFTGRHRELLHTFREHAALITARLDPDLQLTPARVLLLGAAFTHEYAIEGASLCNPSAVLHPDQPDGADDAAFVLSVRGIGEGHRSSIGFRTGTMGADGTVALDRPGPFPELGGISAGTHTRAVFQTHLADHDEYHENAAFVLEHLPARFNDDELAEQIERLAADRATRRNTDLTIAHLQALAESDYEVEFPLVDDLSERVLWPHAPIERFGMEDARFVRFTEPSGRVRYHATYTAWDGVHVTQQVITTDDFATFTMAPMAGAAAQGKGLALFPRMIGDRFAALSRSDRESNSITFSDDLHCWPEAEVIQVPARRWELLQLGNCGSPIETETGWLVITHGVGAMRTYVLGALLLDLDDPRRVLAASADPILMPARGQGGYVPNVVYSCGGFAHGDRLLLPFGIADQRIGFATASISELVASLRPTG
jgi:predicted GH43/DUF377 family glycosyl hydrolase